MKAITLWQPWASLVAYREKRIETRSWYTAYRGPLAIHAAKNFPAEAKLMCKYGEFLIALSRHFPIPVFGWDTHYFDLPLGCVIAICRLSSCIQITESNASGLSEQERAFGDFTPGRFAWMLDDVKRAKTPIPARGFQGLWNWDGLGQFELEPLAIVEG